MQWNILTMCSIGRDFAASHDSHIVHYQKLSTCPKNLPSETKTMKSCYEIGAMRRDLKQIQRKLSVPVVLVTHEPEDICDFGCIEPVPSSMVAGRENEAAP